MRYIYIYILVTFSFFNCFSQTITGIVTNDANQEPLLYANVTLLAKNNGVITNEKGEFLLNVKGSETDSLLVSYLGFASQKHGVRDILLKEKSSVNFQLKENKQLIDEVVLSVKKSRYTSKKKIGVDKTRTKYGTSVQFGFENCVLVYNDKKRKGKLSKLLFFLEKNEQTTFRCYETYYRVKFYEYDHKLKQPGELLSYVPILIKPKENKNQKIELDLSNKHILFPKEGLCIGIETVNPKPKRKINKIHTTYPNLVWTLDDERLTWMSFMSKPWWEKSRKTPSKRPFSKKKMLYSNPLIQLEVQYRK